MSTGFQGIGWEAFGTSASSLVVRPTTTICDWPAAELTNGVHFVECHAYGDDPKGQAPFVRVFAISEPIARAVALHVMLTDTAGWFSPPARPALVSVPDPEPCHDGAPEASVTNLTEYADQRDPDTIAAAKRRHPSHPDHPWSRK